MKSPLILVTAVAMGQLIASAELSVKVVGTPAIGQPLTVEVTAPGDVLVENGLLRQSSNLSGAGKRTHDLGKIQSAGFYHFRFADDSGSKEFVLPVMPTSVKVPKPLPRTATEDSALEKFMSLHTLPAVKEAFNKWPAREAIASRIVAVTSVGTLAVACPFTGVTCEFAGTAAVDLAFDLGIEFENFFVEQCLSQHKLTDAEAQTVKHLLLAAKTLREVFHIENGLDTALAAVNFATSFADQRTQFLMGFLTDETQKTGTLIVVLKRLH